MYFIVYKTTNTVNNKYYIGCHQTDNLSDGYLGSGKLLTRAIKKYGVNNFSFEVLHFAETKLDMFALERRLVTEDVVKDPMSYNLKVGGSGGNPSIVGAFTGKKHSPETKDKISRANKGREVSDQVRKKLSENNWAKRDPIAQQQHAKKIASLPKSDSHKQKLREAIIRNQSNTGIGGKRNKGKIRKRVKCPHCFKEGAMNTMSRWHFDNCRVKSASC